MQWNVFEVADSHETFFRERVILADEQTPRILRGEFYELVFRFVYRFYQKPKIQKPLVQFFRHVLGVAAGDIHTDFRVLRLHALAGRRDKAERLGFTAADIHVAHDFFLARFGEFLFGLAHQFHDFLRSLAESKPFFGQRRLLVAAHEQLHAQFFF